MPRKSLKVGGLPSFRAGWAKGYNGCMKMTFEFLDEILKDGEMRALPIRLAEEKCQHKVWWEMLQLLRVEGAKATIWEGCQTIALLFDTYGESIKSVRLSLNADGDGDDMYMTSSVYINDEQCYEGEINLEEHVIQACENTDECRVLEFAVMTLDMLGNSDLLSEMEVMEKALERDFSGAKQARDVAREFAPEIDRWFVAKVLGRQAQEQIQKKNKITAPKM